MMKWLKWHKRSAVQKGAEIFFSEQIADSSEQLSMELNDIAKQKGWGEYLMENARVALQALELLEIPYDINDLSSLELFGRFYPLTRKYPY